MHANDAIGAISDWLVQQDMKPRCLMHFLRITMPLQHIFCQDQQPILSDSDGVFCTVTLGCGYMPLQCTVWSAIVITGWLAGCDAAIIKEPLEWT